MCGIAGIISKKPEPSDMTMLARMIGIQAHRGPDGETFLNDQQVKLAHRRLSIIDLQGGDQPLYNEDQSLALMVNGEIYNYIELRRQLEASGHQFRTHSDCEVILHLWEELGPEAISKLRGMFALVLWDRHRRELVLVRDRMGEKPLFLYETDDCLMFSSELKGLIASGRVPLKIDRAHADRFLRFNFVPEPMTILQGIRKLAAGAMLRIDIDNWRQTESTYWSMLDAPAIDTEPIDTLEACVDEIGQQIIRADVPVGVALSGGLDSSLVAAVAQANRAKNQTIHAFSAGYSEQHEGDERTDARATAEYLDMPFHEVVIDANEVVFNLTQTIQQLDEPIADYASAAIHEIAKAARAADVPVLLGGIGGDELFWGYGWVWEAMQRTTLMQNNASLKAYLHKPPKPVYQDVISQQLWTLGGRGRAQRALAWWKEKLEKYGQGAQARPILYELLNDFREIDQRSSSWYTAETQTQLTRQSYANACQTWADGREDLPGWLRVMNGIVHTYLRGNGLAQSDRLSMAASVESRSPLVDYRLVETVVGLMKHHGPSSFGKPWLRDVAARKLPAWVLDRPKRGFTPPTGSWYRRWFAEHGHKLVDGKLVEQGLITPEAAHALSEQKKPYSGYFLPATLRMLVLELWLRQAHLWKNQADRES